ncbi:hypothetical protein BC830DRAFT_1082168 [Chytriomyces sp. MP71]|nr:hypothetical protein BC830DRAFT_1082168 [Chytriomyces sp. MP71]
MCAKKNFLHMPPTASTSSSRARVTSAVVGRAGGYARGRVQLVRAAAIAFAVFSVAAISAGAALASASSPTTSSPNTSPLRSQAETQKLTLPTNTAKTTNSSAALNQTQLPHGPQAVRVDLDGCFDRNGVAYSLFVSEDQKIVQQAAQCQAILALADVLGFSDASGAQCQQMVTIQNPPITLDHMPAELKLLSDLGALELNNVFYGDSVRVLSDLFDSLQQSEYLKILNLAGFLRHMNNSQRVLTGDIPELSPGLISSIYFAELWLSGNNFTGGIPSSMADTFMTFSVADNPHLSGPIPTSNFSLPSHSTNVSIEWTNTVRCSFERTQLCIPASWKYQPACQRNASQALPVCGSNESIFPSLDPTDPLVALQKAQAPPVPPTSPNNDGNAHHSSVPTRPMTPGVSGGAQSNDGAWTPQTPVDAGQIAAVACGLALVFSASTLVLLRYRRMKVHDVPLTFGRGGEFGRRRCESRETAAAAIELGNCNGLPEYSLVDQNKPDPVTGAFEEEDEVVLAIDGEENSGEAILSGNDSVVEESERRVKEVRDKLEGPQLVPIPQIALPAHRVRKPNAI